MARATILVIEDCDHIRRGLVGCLEREGYTVFAASDGKEGVRVFDEHRPDLVLTDIAMPYKDGFGVLDHVRSVDPDVGVIMVSAMADDDWIARATAEGATNVLRKPVSLEELLIVIGEALETDEAS